MKQSNPTHLAQLKPSSAAHSFPTREPFLPRNTPAQSLIGGPTLSLSLSRRQPDPTCHVVVFTRVDRFPHARRRSASIDFA